MLTSSAMMTIDEVVAANELWENYCRCKGEIKKLSSLHMLTLIFTGHSSQEIRTVDSVTAVKISLIEACEARASSLLMQLAVKGIDVKEERGYLQTLVSQSIVGPVP